MRVMVLVNTSRDSEANVLLNEALQTEMGTYHAMLAKTSVLRAAERLPSGATGAQAKLRGHKCTITDGPFAETKELIG